jgi:cytochrome c oxidase subunit II
MRLFNHFFHGSALGGRAPKPTMALRTYQLLLIVTASIAGLFAALGTSPHLMAEQTEPVVPIQVRRFEFTPAQIVLKRGVPVILELTSLDVVHGFNVPGLGIRTDVFPGHPTQVRLLPDKIGQFDFRCDHFCGIGHWKVKGAIVVEE